MHGKYSRFPSLKLSAGRDAGTDRDQVRRFRQASTGPAVDDRDTGTESDSRSDLRPKSWFIFGRLYICNLSLALFIILFFSLLLFWLIRRLNPHHTP